MAYEIMVDTDFLREQVKEKYRDVAVNPHGSFHFHTGRLLAGKLGYEQSMTASFPCGLSRKENGWSTSDRGEDSTVSWRPGRLATGGLSSAWT